MSETNEQLLPFYQPPLLGDSRFQVHFDSSTRGFNAHWHSELEILYVPADSAPLSLTVDGAPYLLTPRSAAFVAGTEVHAGVPTAEESSFLVVEFGFALLGDDFSAFAGHRFAAPVVDFSALSADDPRSSVEERLIRLLDARGTFAHPTVTERLQCTAELFALAALLIEMMPLTAVSARRLRQLEAVQAVQSVLLYVERAYPEPISLEQAAAIAGYEKTRFCQIFKQAMGVSFHKYLTDRRMRAALQLLTTTHLPIGRVGESVGILQAKTFSRLIRETYHTTPSELRRQHQADRI